MQPWNVADRSAGLPRITATEHVLFFLGRALKTWVGSALTSLHTTTSFLQKDLEGLLVKSVDFRSEPYPDRRHRRRAPFIEFVPATPQAHLTFWCVLCVFPLLEEACPWKSGRMSVWWTYFGLTWIYLDDLRKRNSKVSNTKGEKDDEMRLFCWCPHVPMSPPPCPLRGKP